MIDKIIFWLVLLGSYIYLSTGFSFNGLWYLGFFAVLLWIGKGFAYHNLKVPRNGFLLYGFIILVSTITLWLTYRMWRSDFSQIKNYGLTILGATIFLMLNDVVKSIKKNEISGYLSIFIYILSSSLFLQLISYYLLNIEIDYGKMFGGQGNRSLAYPDIYRPTGIYDEPAIYGLYMATLLAGKIVYDGKYSLVFFIGVISSFATYSLVSIILPVLIIIAHEVFHKKNKAIQILNLILLLMAIAGYWLFELSFLPNVIKERVYKVLQGNDGSTSNKFEIIYEWMNNYDIFSKGFGFIGLRKWTPSYFDAIYDLSFYVTAIVQYGFYLGITVLIVMYVYAIFSAKSFVKVTLLSILFIKMSSMHALIFWLAFFILTQNITKESK